MSHKWPREESRLLTVALVAREGPRPRSLARRASTPPRRHRRVTLCPRPTTSPLAKVAHPPPKLDTRGTRRRRRRRRRRNGPTHSFLPAPAPSAGTAKRSASTTSPRAESIENTGQYSSKSKTTYGSIVSHSAPLCKRDWGGTHRPLTCASDTALVTRSLRGTPALRMRAARPRAGLARLRSYGAASIASPVRGSRGTAPSWRSRRRTRRDGRTARRCASLGW